MENPNLDQVKRETSALLGRPTPMHSRKKLQKKRDLCPVSKKSLGRAGVVGELLQEVHC